MKSLWCFCLMAILIFAGQVKAQQSISSVESKRPKSKYILPFAKGKSYKLVQGNNGQYGHKGKSQFAYDFQMPIGSEVVAAQDGVVIKIEENFEDNTRKGEEENYIVIKHKDGTFGRYYHLTKNGALVSVGDKVKEGKLIGLSGNSGASFSGHLHFDVTSGCFEYGCQTIEISFKKVKEYPLKDGEFYKSKP